jgi:hypothetical protein
MSAQRHRDRWRWLLLLTAVEATAAAIGLLRMPLESSGLSIARLAGVLTLATFVVVSIAFLRRPPAWTRGPVEEYAITSTAIVSVALGAGLFLLRYLDPERLWPYFERLGVLLGFLLVASLQVLLVLLISHYGLHSRAIRDMKPLIRPVCVATGILLCLLLFVSLTRIGLTPDSAYWGEPGVPILGWQLAMALLGGLAVALSWRYFRRSPGGDIAIAVGIWVVATTVWLSVPNDVLQNSFYAPIRPPSAQPFPNSDAGYYDSMAQSLLIGYPYQGEIPSRPLYIVILAGLHALVGERYDLIIVGQSLILALIPVLLYALGVLLQSRAAGVIAALAGISREWTTLLISSETRVSNTKMLLVDLPTLLLVLAASVFTVRWLQRRFLRDAVLAGGMFGLLLLLRTQAAMIIPAASLLALLVLGPRRRTTYLQLAAFAGAAALTVLPWMARNYAVNGQFSMEAAFQYRIIASQYQYTGNLDIGNVDLEGKSLAGALLSFLLRDPRFVIGFIANHALATQVGAILALPLIHQYNGILADINLYWIDWGGRLSLPNMVLVVVYLLVIGLGLGTAWARLRWVGLVPLSFSLAYSLANGVARFSGWRYDLPADWVAYFYLAVGAAELLTISESLLGLGRLKPDLKTDRPSGQTGGSRHIVAFCAAFMLLGLLPWLGEFFVAPRYAGVTVDALAMRLSKAAAVSEIGVDRAEIEAFRQSPGAILEIGRVLYPRFFTRGNGLASAHPWPSYAPRDFPRVGFVLLDESRHEVVLPIRDVPQDLEHAADAIVLGCIRDDFIEARLVLLEDSGIAYQEIPLSEACP